MKILIIGSTGKLGQQIIKQSIEAGHQVTALARNPKKLEKFQDQIRICEGDVMIPDSLESAFIDQDAVICALGHKRFFIKTQTLSRGTANIIHTMNKFNVRRLICITALGINDSKYRLGLYYTLFTIPVILYFYFKDKAKQENIISESNLNWTIIRPAQFIPGRMRGKYKTGPKVGHYILTKLISRADVAHFVLHELKESSFMHQKPGIAY